MRAVVQRVSHAKVSIGGEIVGKIGKGILVLLGVSRYDTEKEAIYILEKTLNLRIFEDADDKMNFSLLDIKGELLVVSQLTLYGDARKGRRPSYIEAASPEKANALYEFFVAEAQKQIEKVETGCFQAMMNVELVNDGPVTILLDSEKVF
ncbi:MAG: D-tyrosyl-tRNA(Tyr) deacylase [Acidobacteria bacterium]|nr:D-tyrosyl-tRNA(Tyr) deacylase [Acidobacteriota bacterium]MCA1639927.1 D-tyrosyl-tRNA(Tyr) deacylase [Acidobacteriota bacterium]